MMLAYVVSAVVGGVLILLSLFGGHHDGGGGDHDAGHDAGHDADQDTGHSDGHGETHGAPWIPFFSLRFWTYLLAGFGLSGLALTFLTALREPTVAILSGGTGFVAGLLVATMVRWARRAESDTTVREQDLMGREAEVLVGIRPSVPGKVRAVVKGDSIDFLAISDEPEGIPAGATAIIVDVEGDRVRVISRRALLDDETLAVTA